MATERNVVDFKIHNLTEEQFQELKAQGNIDPNAVYCTPDTTKERLDALETKTTSLEENKQDIATAVNYDNITNCITEIPQDIKLELNNGTLTLKAGSNVYLAIGNSAFPTQTVESDIEYTTANSGQYVVIRNSQTSLYVGNIESCASGTIANRPTSTPNASALYFATDENKMYLTGDGGANWYSTTYMTLPIAIITVSGGAISSIDQVFNGVGYIGSTAFVLPGVKGLIPDGRNADGTLKNRNMTVQNVIIKTIPSNTGWHYLTISPSGINGDFATNYYTGTKLPSDATNYSRFYNTAENLTYNVVSGKPTQAPQFVLGCYIDHSTSSPYKINSMKQATTFHAVDYNDFENTVEELNNSVTAWANAKFLPLAGGTMTGPIIYTSNLAVIQKDRDDRQLYIYGGTSPYKGASLGLWGKDSMATGAFYLSTGDGSKSIDLRGKPDGTLTWQDNQLATMPNYSAGVAFTLNKSTPYTAPKDGFVFILTGRANDQGSSITIDGTQVASTISNWSNIPYFFPVAKGTVVSTGHDTISTAIFYPLKGAI